LASDDNTFAKEFLKQELVRMTSLGVNKMVLHPGSASKVSREEAIKNIADALNYILKDFEDVIICLETMAGKGNEIGKDFEDVIICLETMAGKGNEIGKDFEEIKQIIDLVYDKDKIGVCLDTCHLNDAGYDIASFDSILDLFDEVIGIDKIRCIHINDSKNTINSKKDRHENFGFGNIGFDNLINVIYNKRISNIPKILETPYVTLNESSKERAYPPYKFEIEMIKGKNFDPELIDKIREYYS